VLIALLGPPLTELALQFGPAEYFSLMVLGLVAAVVLAHGSVLKAIAMIVVRADAGRWSAPTSNTGAMR
jgi:putative tricarboxylic transport membrane protein